MKKHVEINKMREVGFQYEEAIKTLRTNIQFSGSSVKVVMFTSCIPNEGKSETTFRTAESTAMIGKKVLLIDADIRKSVLAARLGINQELRGLSDYLSGQVKLEDVICSTQVPGLDMLFAGTFTPAAAELVEEPAFEKMLEWARTEYDYIFIDTPPVGTVIDGAIIATKCDGAILLIASGGVSYKEAQRVKQQLEKSGCRILGAVLNMIQSTKGSYYYRSKGSASSKKQEYRNEEQS
ncbi:MAG: CpsD/CapB family tyrosine-protein kinase [Lachnospiraceae bacterium]|nr:CpsD/CapB family tyrosine-protein kinase [Lachnospiraceae bacterium]